MIGWLIIAVLILLLLISLGALMVFQWDIRKMTDQLANITGNTGTNELIRTNTHGRTMKRFVTVMNRLIRVFKQDRRYREKREQQLKQEVTNISHDLRTPLTSIKGFAELLDDPDVSEAQREEFIMIIQKKIDNLSVMVDSFYEISRMDAMDDHMVLERQALDQIVIETMLMYHDDLEQKSLQVDVDEGNVPPVLADRKATNRIVVNIIQNALRYANSYFTVQLAEDEKYVCLRAMNDVEEVDGTDLQHIFERTVSLDDSRSAGQFGLGLYIVQQLTHKQEGTVEAAMDGDAFRIDVYFKKWDQGERF